MENRYFSPEETILTITDRYPELIPFLVSKGFTPLQDEKKRKMMGGDDFPEKCGKNEGFKSGWTGKRDGG